MKTVLLYTAMFLFAVLLSLIAVIIGKDWAVLFIGSLAVLVLVGMGVFIEDK